MTDELTALRARVAELEGLIRWAGECYPATLPWSGAQVELTWDQFNAMRSAIGLKPLKPRPRRKTPDPRDARIAELEAALRGMVSAFESSGNEWGEKLEYEDSALSAARRALGDAHD